MNEQVSLWRGIHPLVGTVVGVGFFGLPFVFAQAGYWVAFLELIVLVGVQILFLGMYADLALAKRGHARFLHIIGDAFGPLGKLIAGLSFFGTLLGAMIACLVAGGEFLSYVISSTLSVIFGLFCMLLLLGGSLVVRNVQKYLVPFFLLTVGILCVGALPAVNPAHFAVVSWSGWVLPLGVILFSLSAISAVPEMRDAFRGNRNLLHRAIFLGMCLVALVYAIFIAIVVGITGSSTPSQAVAAFAGVAPWMVLLGSILGLTTVTTAYVHVGSALINTLLYDFRVRYASAWLLIGGVPFLAVLFGVRDTIGVLQYVGGILGSLIGILVLLAYEKARRMHQLPGVTRAVSPVIVFGIFAVFFVMLVMTLRACLGSFFPIPAPFLVHPLP
jgi:amino acid permease